jgi:hypothetical protein
LTAERLCPACSAEASPPRCFRDLSTLAKVLAVYALIAGAICSLSPPWFDSLPSFTQSALGGIGVAAGILMIGANRAGWAMGLCWSAAQILLLYVDGRSLNRQFLDLHANFLTNGMGLGINAVGIILTILFWKVRSQFPPHPQGG